MPKAAFQHVAPYLHGRADGQSEDADRHSDFQSYNFGLCRDQFILRRPQGCNEGRNAYKSLFRNMLMHLVGKSLGASCLESDADCQRTACPHDLHACHNGEDPI